LRHHFLVALRLANLRYINLINNNNNNIAMSDWVQNGGHLMLVTLNTSHMLNSDRYTA